MTEELMYEIKDLIKNMFKSGEIEIKTHYNLTMDKEYIGVYVDKELVYSNDPFR
jgi:hypothetical protein